MVYELEFYANGSEYEYDIDALTGAVVKSQQESRGSAPSGGAPSGADIGEQGAKEARPGPRRVDGGGCGLPVGQAGVRRRPSGV